MGSRVYAAFSVRPSGVTPGKTTDDLFFSILTLSGIRYIFESMHNRGLLTIKMSVGIRGEMIQIFG